MRSAVAISYELEDGEKTAEQLATSIYSIGGLNDSFGELAEHF
jgi:hypothetical protein